MAQAHHRVPDPHRLVGRSLREPVLDRRHREPQFRSVATGSKVTGWKKASTRSPLSLRA